MYVYLAIGACVTYPETGWESQVLKIRWSWVLLE